MSRKALLTLPVFSILAFPASAADVVAPAQEVAPAQQPAAKGLLTSGVADFWLGYVFIDADLTTNTDLPPDTWRAGGQALFNIPIGDQFSAQLDLSGDGDFTNASNSTTDDYAGQILGGGHLSYRDPNAFLLGGFAGIGEAFLHEPGVVSDKHETGWMVGGEGQYYLGNTTFYGQAGYFDTDGNDPETLVDAWFARGVIRHFFTPNSMLSGEFTYGQGTNTEGTPDDIAFAGWEVLYKQQIDSTHFAWFVSYDGHYVEVDKNPTSTEDEHLYEHAFKVGLSFKFGADTLLEQDRYGATLDLPADPLRAAGYTVDVVD